MANKALLRISREITNIQKGDDLSLAVAYHEKNVYNVKALIVGPADTPYQFGFYEFNVVFPEEYPEKAPHVLCTTTNAGKTRFNPNIYASGKVCLSILGTWRGERGEEWSSAQGLESVLISIQSLMSGNPYENEPGYENAVSDSDKKNMADYVDKIRHESLRISVIQRMEQYLGIYSDGSIAEPAIEPPSRVDVDEDEEENLALSEPFKDLCKRRFLWYYESYLTAIDEGIDKHRSVEAFKRMPFEGGGNDMQGRFEYGKLRERLLRIKTVLDQETTVVWPAQGVALRKRDSPFASQLQRSYRQVRDKVDGKNLSVDLVTDDDPFVWQLTHFGKPMSNLDGAMFVMKMYISPRFPEEQPRVIMETKPMFHHRVAADGTICYFPQQKESLFSHIEAVLDALENENPTYDPRTHVNLDACKQFWGGDEPRKQYNRQLRRAVQRSLEG